MEQNKSVTVITFAREIGMKGPQYMYQLIDKGQVPKELITYRPKGDGGEFQPMVDLVEGKKWWADRVAKRQTGKTIHVVPEADQVIARLADMASTMAGDDPDVAALAALLKKIMAPKGGEN